MTVGKVQIKLKMRNKALDAVLLWKLEKNNYKNL